MTEAVARKVSELEGDELDYWVARARGFYGLAKDFRTAPIGATGVGGSPSTEWSIGGQIIDREGISLSYESRAWFASIPILYEVAMAMGRRNGMHEYFAYGKGPHPLIAAMRCFVASRFGEEVSDAKK